MSERQARVIEGTLVHHYIDGAGSGKSRGSDNRVGSMMNRSTGKPYIETLIGMTDSFCGQYLTEEYAELCRTLARALDQMRPSPLTQDSVEIWACGIIRTIGWVNFLHDSNQTPHLNPSVIDEAFGVATRTGQEKSAVIREMFTIRHFEPRWTLPSHKHDNPRVANSNGYSLRSMQ
jgi:hypothetical protein